MYNQDLGGDIFTHNRSWRWVRVRLWHILASDTLTRRLYEDDKTTPKPTRSHPASARSLTPEGVGNLLDSWVN